MIQRRSRWPRVAAALVLALGVLVLGIWIGGHPSWLPSSLRSALIDDKQGQLVNQVMGLISRNYYRKVNTDDLLNKGLAAAVASLDDPYSHYLDPTDYHQFQTQSNPHVSGVGIDVSTVAQGLKVLDVFPGTPAAQAGLKAGALIVAVGKTSLAGRSAERATGLITGQEGTRVRLTVVQDGRRRVLDLRRANVLVSSGGIVDVHGVKLGDVRLTSFTDGSGAAVRTQVQKVLHQGARGLILDLRDNPGGLLEEAVNVGSLFIPDGTIVSTDGRSQPRQVYTAKGDAIAPRIPMVVLVDRGTASAAEIVTGALQDRGRAKVVGTRTYGKGVFQELQTLSNGGALDIVTGRWFEPSGRNVGGPGVTRGGGIQPNVTARLATRSGADRPLHVAEQVLLGELP
jgi:carboxyl-terminal processing protease